MVSLQQVGRCGQPATVRWVSMVSLQQVRSLTAVRRYDHLAATDGRYDVPWLLLSMASDS